MTELLGRGELVRLVLVMLFRFVVELVVVIVVDALVMLVTDLDVCSRDAFEVGLVNVAWELWGVETSDWWIVEIGLGVNGNVGSDVAGESVEWTTIVVVLEFGIHSGLEDDIEDERTVFEVSLEYPSSVCYSYRRRNITPWINTDLIDPPERLRTSEKNESESSW